MPSRFLADEAVKKDYEEEICKTCHTTRIRYSWSPLDTASMARKVGKNYSDLYYDAYYMPTLQTHTTVASVIARLQQNPDGSIGFSPGPQRDAADKAAILAHHLLLLVVREQNEHFKLGLDAEIHGRAAEFLDTYKRADQAAVRSDPAKRL